MTETNQINMEIIVDYCAGTQCDWIQVKTTEGQDWNSDLYRVQVAGICPACGRKTKQTIIKRTYEPKLTDKNPNREKIKSESVLPMFFETGSSLHVDSIPGGKGLARGLPVWVIICRTWPDGTTTRGYYQLDMSTIDGIENARKNAR